MKRILRINEEFASPRLPENQEYWLSKGKIGKKVHLFTHDDMDGIFTAIQMKKYLLDRGFEIVKYGLLNYNQKWDRTTLDPKLINIVLDFAFMPGDDRDQLIDFYIDHHGLFNQEELERYKKSPVLKRKTPSAWEALCDVLSIPKDELVASVINMIDSADYEGYGVSWQRLLDFNLEEIKNSPKARLEFAAAFNQFLKRSDTQTILEVIKNTKDCSIFAIYNYMKELYPQNNQHLWGPKRGENKDFVQDSKERLKIMQSRTRGRNEIKKVYNSWEEFSSDWTSGNGEVSSLDGYQVIGNLVVVPSGTWTNGVKVRPIIEKDIMDGKIQQGYSPNFILIQYGNTLQVCSYHDMNYIDNLPVLKNGSKVDNLGEYMSGLLLNFRNLMGYNSITTKIGQDERTVSGGHQGIGTINNIEGICQVDGPFQNMKWLDIFKNKIISDLSGVPFPLKAKWRGSDNESSGPEPKMDNKVRTSDELRTLRSDRRIHRFDEF